MTGGLLASLAQLELPARAAERAGLDSVLRLRRAWPRGTGRLSCEFRDGEGLLVAGQWFGHPDGRPDRARLELIRHRTAAAVPQAPIAALPGAGVLLQPAGADRRLPDLAAVSARPDATLVVHRPERRATVRLDAGPGLATTRWAKLVRPGRTLPMLAAAQAAATHAPFSIPRLVAHEPHRGLTVWSGLTGATLRSLLAGVDVTQACRRLGQGLRALHGQAASEVDHWTVRDAATEYRWTGEWVGRLEGYVPPELTERADHALLQVAPWLDGTPTDQVPIHADLHDGQVIVGADGALGVLDWDTLALGEAATDLANLLVHFEPRVLGAACPADRAEAAAGALLEGYRPSAAVRGRLAGYLAAVRLRLACLYAFRPGQQAVTTALLDRLTAPAPGLSPLTSPRSRPAAHGGLLSSFREVDPRPKAMPER